MWYTDPLPSWVARATHLGVYQIFLPNSAIRQKETLNSASAEYSAKLPNLWLWQAAEEYLAHPNDKSKTKSDSQSVDLSS